MDGDGVELFENGLDWLKTCSEDRKGGGVCSLFLSRLLSDERAELTTKLTMESRNNESKRACQAVVMPRCFD